MQGCLQLCNAFQRGSLLQSGAVYFAVMRPASLASVCTRGKKPEWCKNMIVKPHSTRLYVDMTMKLPLVDPAKLTMPVQIIRKEFDGIATENDLLAFFRQLGTSDREFVVLPGAAHAVALGLNPRQFWHVMRRFLDMPTRLDAMEVSG
jgi:pimeloyl-ACP methyl ester carboxylesterase